MAKLVKLNLKFKIFKCVLGIGYMLNNLKIELK